MIEIKNLTYCYRCEKDKPVYAIKNVNLQIREGEFIAIMGHNSCGKTTFARCLNGLIQPTSGEVIVDGLSTNNEKNILAIRKKVGCVFQNPDNQIVTTSVEREIAFGLENLGVRTEIIHQVVNAILNQFDLALYSQHPPHLLSGGEKQRLALASVLAMNPKYLVFDEPTSMLDPQGRQDLLALLKEIKADNALKKTVDQITIFLITQFPEEALIAERLLVMEHGKFSMDEAPQIVFQQLDQLKKNGLEAPVEFEILPLLVERGLEIDILKNFL
jgi:energy-coupling factor transport system ATP-binding protein